MRSVEEIERDLAEARQRSEELEHEKREAEEDARSPRKEMIRRRYVVIAKMLGQLRQLGESVGDVEGYALHLKGKSFEIGPDHEVREI